MKSFLIRIGIGIAAILVAIQFVPYGRDHTNPPVNAEPNWDSPQTRELARRACFDCHSNESTWPWYSNIAPISWLVQRDVDEGREALNFSEWGSSRFELEEIFEVMEEGEMPPSIYLLQHADARLTASEKNELVQGLTDTFR